MKMQFVVLCLIVSFWGKTQTLPDSRNQEIVFKNIAVIPMNTEGAWGKQTVVIKDGIIQKIGKNLSYSKDALVIDGKGKFLMPGLADMHGHIPMGNNIESMQDALYLFAVNGVTTLRNMLGQAPHLEVRRKIQSGEMIGPRVYTAGAQFSGRDVKTEEAGIEQVKREKQAGYDVLKMKEGLSLANFKAIAKTAKEVGVPMGGHVPFQVGIINAAELGFSTVDHLDGIIPALVPRLDTFTEREVGMFGMYVAHLADLSKLDNIFNILLKNNVWLVPTQSFGEHWQSPKRLVKDLMDFPEMKYMDKKTLENWSNMKGMFFKDSSYSLKNTEIYLKLRQKIVYEAQKKGVGIMLGTDAAQVFSIPGFAVHRELIYLVEAGLTPYQALCTSTLNVGKYFKNDKIGVINTGANADLLLLNANPLKDIRATSAIDGVMLNGRWLSKTEIDNILKKLVK